MLAMPQMPKRFGLLAALGACLLPAAAAADEKLVPLDLGIVNSQFPLTVQAPEGARAADGIGVDVKKGQRFQIEFTRGGHDLAKRKAEIRENTLNKLRKFHVEDETTLLYETAVFNAVEFHFVTNVKVGDAVYGAEDAKGVAYTRAEIDLMLRCARTLAAKGAPRPDDAPDPKPAPARRKPRAEGEGPGTPVARDASLARLAELLRGTWTNGYPDYLAEIHYDLALDGKVLRGKGVTGKGSGKETHDEVTIGHDPFKDSFYYLYLSGSGLAYRGTARLEGNKLRIAAEALAGPPAKCRATITFVDGDTYRLVCEVLKDDQWVTVLDVQMKRKA